MPFKNPLTANIDGFHGGFKKFEAGSVSFLHFISQPVYSSSFTSPISSRNNMHHSKTLGGNIEEFLEVLKSLKVSFLHFVAQTTYSLSSKSSISFRNNLHHLEILGRLISKSSLGVLRSLNLEWSPFFPLSRPQKINRTTSRSRHVFKAERLDDSRVSKFSI